VTQTGSKDFIPVAERIAVFDNDGTLWSERPVYFQLLFAMDRVKALADENPQWKTTQPFRRYWKMTWSHWRRLESEACCN
jgi:hypothetical protein